ncbi:MAG TPA: hypothetical protein VF210_09920 [Pseudomonadales bacterium]
MVGGGRARLIGIGAGFLTLGIAVGGVWLATRPVDSGLKVLGVQHRLAGRPLTSARLPRPPLADVQQIFDAAWRGDDGLPNGGSSLWSARSLGVYVGGRAAGRRLGQVWDVGPGTVREAVQRAVAALRDGRGGASDTIEAFIVTERRHLDAVNRAHRSEMFDEAHRGVRGFELQWGDRLRIYSPTYLLAANRSVRRQMDIAFGELGLTQTDFEAGGEYYGLDGPQYLIELPDGASGTRAVEMHRGNILVPLDAVTAESTRRMADRAAAWMARSVQPDGRFPYKLWPASGMESESNNTIRQWMASHALVKAAARSGDPEDWARATRNIEYNLATFYREEAEPGGALGLIDYEGKIKLGAVALAALVLAEHRDAERWRPQYLALNRTVEALWHESGRFDTFYRKPPGTREQPNFYPGEALLMLVDRYQREPDPRLLERIMTSFRYYRSWHLRPANRNPAFVPWHVRAYTKLWRETRDPELASFVFEMSDWLLSMQEWTPAYPDFLGRFHDPKRRRFGPPHASSTGVYLEGYIEAFRLAKDLGERRRAERYRKAIIGGLRSLMQLQFVDEIDMYYIGRRSWVAGAMRTTVYDNEIRCDNVQHGLMAMFEILEHFDEDDYRL